MNAPLGRDDADQLLTGIGAAHDRIAAAMYAIDVHPGLGLLRGGTLTGATEARWRALRPEVDLLWAHFAVLGQTLEEARAIRAGRRPGDQQWAELTHLLRDSAVELAADGMPVTTISGTPVSGTPLSGIPLPGTPGRPGAAGSWITLRDLARQLEQRCATVARHLSEVDAAFSAVAARLTPVTVAVDSVVALANELGESDVGADLRASLERAQGVDLGDPLTAAPGGRLTAGTQTRWVDLEAEADRARRLLEERARVRGGYPQLRAALGGLVDDLATAEDAVAQTHREVSEKIAEPGLAALPTSATALRARLAELDRLHARALTEAALWRRLVDDLRVVEQATQQARDRARQLRALAEGLLARRTELRGRLDAYRAKAAARGLAEHAELTAEYARARELLYTAPCDLRASTRSVHAYQQTLAAVLATSATSKVTPSDDEGRPQ
jgi:hypothetical protein